MTTNPDRSTVKTTETTFDIVDTIRELEGARIDEVADHLSIAKSTVHRHLTTLHSRDYVVKEGDEYHIGLQFLTVGADARRRNPIYNLAKEKVEQLADETNERAQFIVEEQGRRVYLYFQFGENAVRTDGAVGVKGPLHMSAAGKALLASQPDDRVSEIIDQHGLPAHTPNTITDLDDLFDELESIRESGVAYNDEESSEGLRAVAVPVHDPSDRVLGALSVSGPAHRIEGERYQDRIPKLILGHANEIELSIKYM